LSTLKKTNQKYSRPTYETRQDLKNEKTVATYAMERLGIEQLVKLPRKYQIDYGVIRRGEGNKKYIIGLLEIKCRTIAKDKYDTYMISADKMNTALQYYNNFNIGFSLIVSWTDVVGVFKLNKDFSPHLGFSGRYDRGDWEDVEPVCYIPTKNFSLI
tara:strand:- start:88 stop:558 length:471 start_codon:yes stop_codon:yes gene_type:complete